MTLVAAAAPAALVAVLRGLFGSFSCAQFNRVSPLLSLAHGASTGASS